MPSSRRPQTHEKKQAVTLTTSRYSSRPTAAATTVAAEHTSARRRRMYAYACALIAQNHICYRNASKQDEAEAVLAVFECACCSVF